MSFILSLLTLLTKISLYSLIDINHYVVKKLHAELWVRIFFCVKHLSLEILFFISKKVCMF